MEEWQVWINKTKVPVGIGKPFLSRRQINLLNPRVDIQCGLQKRLIRLVVKLRMEDRLVRLIHVHRGKICNIDFHPED